MATETRNAAAGNLMTSAALNDAIANTVQGEVAGMATAVTGAANEATALNAAKTTALTNAYNAGTQLATPYTSAPTAVAGVNAAAGDGQVTVSWSPKTGATSYNLYWSTISGVTKANGTKITGVSSPYIHSNKVNGTTYYYVVAAVNSAGVGAASGQVMATPVAAAVAGTHSASGTYTWNAGTGTLTLNYVSTNFCGGIAGTDTKTGTTVSATTITRTGSPTTWTRSSGAAGDIVGTWTGTDPNGVVLTAIYNANGTFSVSGVEGACTAAAASFMADAATGVFQTEFQVSNSGTSLDWGRVKKMTLTPNGAAYASLEVGYQTGGGSGVWSAFSYGAGATAGTEWRLTPTSPGGWVDTSNGKMGSAIAADGTFTVSNLSSNGSSIGDSFSMTVTKSDMAGLPLQGCIGHSNVGDIPCPIVSYTALTYPAGSVMYRFSNNVANNDNYQVDLSNNSGYGGAGTDTNGVALTALPALGASFCIPQNYDSLQMALYQPVASPAAGANNYTQKWTSGDCSAANIATLAAQPGYNTLMLTSKATGNAAAPAVLLMTYSNCPTCNEMFAYIPGKGVAKGWFNLQGPETNNGSNGMSNRIAFDAEVAAAKAVVGVTGMGNVVPTLP